MSAVEWYEALQIAIVAYVFVTILFVDGHIFSFWGNGLERWVYGNNPFKPKEGDVYYRRIPWRDYLSKPLGLCLYCFAGQLAFWVGILNFQHSIWRLTIFVCATLLILKIIDYAIGTKKD